MRCFIGIDLGSTTTKAVVIDEDAERPRPRHHQLALELRHRRRDRQAGGARRRALHALPRRARARGDARTAGSRLSSAQLERDFRLEQFLEQLADLEQVCKRNADGPALRRRREARRRRARRGLQAAPRARRPRCSPRARSARATSSATSPAAATSRSARRSPRRRACATTCCSTSSTGRSSRSRTASTATRCVRNLRRALDRTFEALPEAAVLVPPQSARRSTASLDDRSRGDLRGRHRLRSRAAAVLEGAHPLRDPVPRPRRARDVSAARRPCSTSAARTPRRSRSTRAGIVENFQMNDRCAAGCGRYLGYIADEMNMGLHELGPLAMKATKTIKINSTCTVFAGAELRDRLSLGEQARGHHGRPPPRDHPARDVDPRALGRGARRVHLHRRRGEERGRGARRCASWCARTTARVTLNINPDSIYTGALGGATFAWRAVVEEGQGGGGAEHDPHRRHRHRLGRGQDACCSAPRARNAEWLAKRCERIRRRDPLELAQRGLRRGARGGGAHAATTSPTSRPPAKARTSSSPPGTSTR